MNKNIFICEMYLFYFILFIDGKTPLTVNNIQYNTMLGSKHAYKL